MEFDRGRDIVEDIFNVHLPDVNIVDHHPLERIERVINIDDDEQEEPFSDEELDDEEDYDVEWERGRKRRRARHTTGPDFTPLEKRRVAGNKQVGETGFVIKILDDTEVASELELENFRKRFHMPVELFKEIVDELKRGGFDDKSEREGK